MDAKVFSRSAFRRLWRRLQWSVRCCCVASLVVGSVPRLDAQAPLLQGDPNALVHRIQGPSERLEMTVNTSRIVTLDQKIPEVQVNNPEILKVTPISPNEIQVFAQKTGVTSVHLRTIDKRVFTVDVIVYADARELTMLLRSQFPKSTLTVVPLANSVIVSGYVDEPSHVNTIIRIAEDYYPNVINNIRVGGAQQVLLKVKVYEVSRTKLRNLGVDLSVIASGGQSAITSVSQLLAATGTNFQQAGMTGGQTVTLGVMNAGSSTFGVIEALRQDQLAKVLAEPTLVTVSGRPAYFNAGGEFPIPIPQSLGTVSIQYKPYGTQVDFVPIVLGNGKLRLEVRPRVSDIDPARSVTLNGSTVPALTVSEIDTGVEMMAGQTLAIGGLVQQRTEALRRGIPYLMDVPYLGMLFSRKHEQQNEVELLVMVTPEFAAAMDPCEVPPCQPGTMTMSPSDFQLYYKNHIEVPKVCPPGMTGAGGTGCPPGAPCGPGNQPGAQQFQTTPQMAPTLQAVPNGPRTEYVIPPTPRDTSSSPPAATGVIVTNPTITPSNDPIPRLSSPGRAPIQTARMPQFERVPAAEFDGQPQIQNNPQVLEPLPPE